MRFPVIPAAFPIRTAVIAHAIAQHLDRPRYPASPHVENKFSATSALRHFRAFGFRRARSRFIFHRVSQVNKKASGPTSIKLRLQQTPSRRPVSLRACRGVPKRRPRRKTPPTTAPTPRSSPHALAFRSFVPGSRGLGDQGLTASTHSCGRTPRLRWGRVCRGSFASWRIVGAPCCKMVCVALARPASPATRSDDALHRASAKTGRVGVIRSRADHQK
jgi:hypothetical protein